MPFTPTQNPGPSRNVQSWTATSDRPTTSSEPPPAPIDPAKSSRNVRIDRRLIADTDDCRFNRARRDIAQREGLALSPENREHHDGRADIADHQKDLQQGAEGDTSVVTRPEDVVSLVQDRLVQNQRRRDRRDEREGHQPSSSARGPLLGLRRPIAVPRLRALHCRAVPRHVANHTSWARRTNRRLTPCSALQVEPSSDEATPVRTDSTAH
jgi:hypothetical protein